MPPTPTPAELSAGLPEDWPTPTLFSIEVAGVPTTVGSTSGLGAEFEVVQFQGGDDRNVAIILPSSDGTPLSTFTLLGAWLCAWHGADGNFASLQTWMTEIDICYDELVRS